jgi:hypothetical protein
MWPCFEVGQWFVQITSSFIASPLAQGLMVGVQYIVVGCWQGELAIQWRFGGNCIGIVSHNL